MELINFNDLKNKKIIATIGEFDGIHLGHKKLINKTITLAKENNCSSCVISFYPHPDYVLMKRVNDGYLTPEEIKQELFNQMNIDYLIILDFNLDVASMDYISFYNEYLSDLYGLVIGYDFQFGKMGEGNALFLEKMFKSNNKVFSIINKVTFLDESNQYCKVGSNFIRKYLQEGNLDIANSLLSRPYMLKGKVINGDHVGRKIGFPTANILLDKDSFLIKKGVYACKCHINNNEYIAIANIGKNPTLNILDYSRLEVHIINFNDNIYDKEIRVYFYKYLRDEVKYNTKEELINQLKIDKINTLNLLGGINNDK